MAAICIWMSTAHSQLWPGSGSPTVLVMQPVWLRLRVACWNYYISYTHTLRLRRRWRSSYATHQDEIRIMARIVNVAPPTSLITSQETEAMRLLWKDARASRAKILTFVVPLRNFFPHFAAASNSFSARSGCHLVQIRRSTFHFSVRKNLHCKWGAKNLMPESLFENLIFL